MWHLYLIPMIGTGTRQDPRRPKYIDGLGASTGVLRYGFQPVALVALDVDDDTDATLAANVDVQKIPDDLDNTIGPNALSIIQNALEDRNIPSQWVTSNITYRMVLRTLYGFFSFLQRYSAIANTTALVFGGAVTLNTQFNQLSGTARTNLRNTATDLGLTLTGIPNTSTLREVLKLLADQWGQREFVIGGVTI